MTVRDLKEYTSWLVMWFAIIWWVAHILAIFPIARDDTDSGGWGIQSRSGVKPRTDALTGCQYLETDGGGITPRLGTDGKQVGCKR